MANDDFHEDNPMFYSSATPTNSPSPSQPPLVLFGHQEQRIFDDDDSYFNNTPPGFRFLPTHGELIVYYLKRKLQNLPLPRNKIVEVNIYDHHPRKLAGRYKSKLDGKFSYFFTRKYQNDSRLRRPAGHGFWKATVIERAVKHSGHIVGLRKSFDFYVRMGKAQKLIKTNWRMNEYRMKDHPDDMRLDEWVLCRIEDRNNRRTPKNKEECSLENKGEDDDEEDKSSLLYQSDPYPVCSHNLCKQFRQIVLPEFSCIVR